MSEPFLGEVKLISFSFAPKDWAYCDGQALPIEQNNALFALVGTQFGGDGRITFNLPDLRGRTPIHSGSGIYQQGLNGGLESVTLSLAEMGGHYHDLVATESYGSKYRPTPSATKTFATANDSGAYIDLYGLASTEDKLTQLNPDTTSSNGGGKSHSNVQPSIVVGFVMALTGMFPSRN